MINNIFLLFLCYYNELLGITIKKQSVFIAQLFANGSKATSDEYLRVIVT